MVNYRKYSIHTIKKSTTLNPDTTLFSIENPKQKKVFVRVLVALSVITYTTTTLTQLPPWYVFQNHFPIKSKDPELN